MLTCLFYILILGLGIMGAIVAHDSFMSPFFIILSVLVMGVIASNSQSDYDL